MGNIINSQNNKIMKNFNFHVSEFAIAAQTKSAQSSTITMTDGKAIDKLWTLAVANDGMSSALSFTSSAILGKDVMTISINAALPKEEQHNIDRAIRPLISHFGGRVHYRMIGKRKVHYFAIPGDRYKSATAEWHNFYSATSKVASI